MSAKNSDATQNDGLPELLDKHQVAKYLCVSWFTLKTWVRKGQFPRPRILGYRTHRWDGREIDEWFAAGCPRIEKDCEAPTNAG